MSSTTLAARLAVIGKDIGWIEKGGYNDAQKYKFVSESDVVATLKPALAEAGIMVLPSHRLLSVEPFTTAKGRHQFLTTIESTFTFTDGNETLIVQTIGQGTDSGDKGVYKAMTGAKKYALLQAFLIATGDDPEVTTNDERTTVPPSRGRGASGGAASGTRGGSEKPSNTQPVEAGDSKSGASSPAANVVAAAGRAIQNGKLSETAKKRIFALGADAKLSKEALGELRLKITGKHSSAQMTDADGEKLIAALELQIATLREIEAATGGTVVEK
jgi:hypothetical protein